ncbi:short chain dehydrogenase reductase family protein [Stylonychia lemnae]|uniref:Short chain dehydrogenase reductase family protein n=1 Tax=Stylonychia lemnae TaxID=5949 RepID=A0A077ZSU0_STYLE|nr:short chain dehydrogenase reductase family protein [Stylonychia lemnae]|eukprot:CDW72624.1 short chain dehydrogenase reductase family protein [Stylonychia lemnae]
MLVGLLKLIKQYIFRRELDLHQVYGGKESWALVTGGSDGIGFQYCIDLAKRGFNICIVSRNAEKIDLKIQELKQILGDQASSLKFRSVVADFSKMSQISQYQELATKVQDIDVGMLILNAGTAVFGKFQNLTDQEVEELVNLNAIHNVYLFKVFVDKLYLRQKRSAVVLLSSALGLSPVPGIAVYSASKAFLRHIGIGVGKEVRDKIDIQTFVCGQVNTSLNPGQASGLKTTAVMSVKNSLRDIGQDLATAGPIQHVLQGWIVKNLSFGVDKIMLKAAEKKSIEISAKKIQ